MKVGDIVTWKSQAGGYWKEKTGTIVSVIPANTDPCDLLKTSEFKLKTSEFKLKEFGFPRNHESYLVRIGKRINLNWPRASLLQKKQICSKEQT